MVVGLGVFALIARGLNPREFGFVALVFSYASLGSLLTDFGLAMKTLRDIAHYPEDGKAILASTLRLKSVLSAIVTVVGFLVVVFLPMGAHAKIASCLLTAGVMVASFGDLALVAFRSTRRFGRECWIVGWTSVIYGIVVALVVHFGGGILPISVAFLLCRAGYAAVAMHAAMRLFPAGGHARPLPSVWVMLKSSWSWALLSNLSYINGQLGGVLIAPLLGLHDTGIFHAGHKFAGSTVTFTSVVTNTQVPLIAAAAAKGHPTWRLELTAWAQMIFAGGVFAVCLIVGGPFITKYLIGKQYAEVNSMWFGFAFLTFCRFLSSSVLISLVALNRSKLNLIGEAATTIVTVPLMFALLPQHGLVSVPWILSAGALSTFTVLLVGRLGPRAMVVFAPAFIKGLSELIRRPLQPEMTSQGRLGVDGAEHPTPL